MDNPHAGSPDMASLFQDGKDPQALRTIGEVARALSIRPHVLRYWEEQFPALQPVKRGGNRRYYRPEDVALIARIDRLVHHEGYTLRGACKALGGKLAPDAEQKEDAPFDGEFVQKLQAIRADLARALAAA
ncbi:MerR family transcriptional regulator [Novosphingobium soli]|uniref:MerR family transcriptional regulator n=1 Tax=Novosphingobium soli TaxID=574956 RepID=A0ABV6CVX8_9SPHN